MKKSLYIILLLLPLLCSCMKEEGAVDTALRVSIWAQDEESATFTMKGKTASGNDSYSAVVTFVSGSKTGGVSWTAGIEGSPSWASVEKIKIRKAFDGTYPGEDMDVWYDGVRITVEPNLDRARRFNLVITASDGRTFSFPFIQEGLQNNPSIVYEGPEVEMMFVSEEATIPFETNTPDEITCDIEYEAADVEWLSVKSIADDHLVIEALQNEDENFDRRAVLTLTAGSETTVQAQTQVVVKQLRKGDYWFIYGDGINDGLSAGEGDRLEMAGRTAAMTAWFEDGHGIFLTHNSKKAGYPYYALAEGGKLELIESEASSLPVPPAIDIDGMRILKIDTSLLEWSFERVSTQNCCPDSEVASYPQKDYPTETGALKTWMTVSLHWNGGADLSPIKLGSGLVTGSKATGGYGEAATPQPRNPLYDTRENGGVIEEVPGLADKWGRLYSIHEALTGEPGGALSPSLVVGYPLDNTFVDAVGHKYTNASFAHASLGKVDGDDAAVEQTYPAVKAQVQGICPYGWHIANLQDWKDLMWAVSQKDASAADYTYASFADGTITGGAPLLLSKEYKTYASRSETPHAEADAFAFNLFPQGWRLYKTGYDLGPGTTSARFCTFIPLMGSKVSQVWRVQYDSGKNMSVNSTLDIGNVSGCAVRCVKNYR